MSFDLSPEQFEKALSVYQAEPVHEIGQIQPYAACLVVSRDAPHVIIQASDNLERFIYTAASGVLGRPLDSVIGEQGVVEIQQLMAAAVEDNSVYGWLERDTNRLGLSFSVHLCTAGDAFILELELVDRESEARSLKNSLTQISNAMQAGSSGCSLQAYLDEVTVLIRGMTGYDNVMIYRFDEDWNGEVVSQAHHTDFGVYKGMHFPAADIPAQARSLYERNLIRMVVDIDAAPVAIIPASNPGTGLPLDMTYSATRSLSRAHAGYLRNMGVAASMTISILYHGQLWGLIFCHHRQPKLVSVDVRVSATFISKLIPIRLADLVAAQERKTVQCALAINSKLLSSSRERPFQAVIASLAIELQQLVGATGMAIIIDGECHLFGDTPGAEAVEELVDWLAEQTIGGFYHSHHLSASYQPAAAYPQSASGIMAVAEPTDPRNCLLWLRKEYLQTIDWAANDADALVSDNLVDDALTPRRSFEIWTETKQAQSLPWSGVEISVAKQFAASVPAALHRKVINERQST